jgi:hypothetical protein
VFWGQARTGHPAGGAQTYWGYVWKPEPRSYGPREHGYVKNRTPLVRFLKGHAFGGRFKPASIVARLWIVDRFSADGGLRHCALARSRWPPRISLVVA